MQRRKVKNTGVKVIFKSVIAIAIMIWLFHFLFTDSYASILGQIIHTSKQGVILLSILEIAFILLDSVTISLLVKRYRNDYSYREGLAVLLYGNFYKGITFGSGTKMSQLYLLNKQNVPVGASSGILTMQYVFHRIAIMVNATIMMVMFAPFSFFDFAAYKSFLMLGYIVNLLVILILVLICIWKDFHDMLLYLSGKVLRYLKKEAYLCEVEKYFNELEGESHFLLEKSGWCIKDILVNCLKLFCCYAMPYIIFMSITGEKPGATFMEVMALTAIMQLLLGIIPAPVGMGSTEVVYLILFSMLFGKVMAGTTMIIYRLFTYYAPFLISVVFIIFYNRIEEKKASKIEEKYIG